MGFWANGFGTNCEVLNMLRTKTQIAEMDALLASLKSAYTDFSDGGKWAFGSAYDTVVNHVRRGDIAAAKLTVQMIQIPAEVPGVSAEELATWTEVKAKILALFP